MVRTQNLFALLTARQASDKFAESQARAEDQGRSMEPIKKVLISALIIVIIVGFMVGVMLVGELLVRWL